MDDSKLWYQGCEYRCQLCQKEVFLSSMDLLSHITIIHQIVIDVYKKLCKNRVLETKLEFFDCKLCEKKTVKKCYEEIFGHLLYEHGTHLWNYQANSIPQLPKETVSQKQPDYRKETFKKESNDSFILEPWALFSSDDLIKKATTKSESIQYSSEKSQPEINNDDKVDELCEDKNSSDEKEDQEIKEEDISLSLEVRIWKSFANFTQENFSYNVFQKAPKKEHYDSFLRKKMINDKNNKREIKMYILVLNKRHDRYFGEKPLNSWTYTNDVKKKEQTIENSNEKQLRIDDINMFLKMKFDFAGAWRLQVMAILAVYGKLKPIELRKLKWKSLIYGEEKGIFKLKLGSKLSPQNYLQEEKSINESSSNYDSFTFHELPKNVTENINRYKAFIEQSLGPEHLKQESFVIKKCRGYDAKQFSESLGSMGKNQPRVAGKHVASLIGLKDPENYSLFSMRKSSTKLSDKEDSTFQNEDSNLLKPQDPPKRVARDLDNDDEFPDKEETGLDTFSNLDNSFTDIGCGEENESADKKGEKRKLPENSDFDKNNNIEAEMSPSLKSQRVNDLIDKHGKELEDLFVKIDNEDEFEKVDHISKTHQDGVWSKFSTFMLLECSFNVLQNAPNMEHYEKYLKDLMLKGSSITMLKNSFNVLSRRHERDYGESPLDTQMIKTILRRRTKLLIQNSYETQLSIADIERFLKMEFKTAGKLRLQVMSIFYTYGKLKGSAIRKLKWQDMQFDEEKRIYKLNSYPKYSQDLDLDQETGTWKLVPAVKREFTTQIEFPEEVTDIIHRYKALVGANLGTEHLKNDSLILKKLKGLDAKKFMTRTTGSIGKNATYDAGKYIATLLGLKNPEKYSLSTRKPFVDSTNTKNETIEAELPDFDEVSKPKDENEKISFNESKYKVLKESKEFELRNNLGENSDPNNVNEELSPTQDYDITNFKENDEDMALKTLMNIDHDLKKFEPSQRDQKASLKVSMLTIHKAQLEDKQTYENESPLIESGFEKDVDVALKDVDRHYTYSWNNFVRFIQLKFKCDINKEAPTADHYEAYIKHLFERSKKYPTIQTLVSYINNYHDKYYQERPTKKWPHLMKLIKQYKTLYSNDFLEKRNSKSFTEDQINKFLDMNFENAGLLRLQAMVILQIYGKLNHYEVRQVKWGDLFEDETTGDIRIKMKRKNVQEDNDESKDRFFIPNQIAAKFKKYKHVVKCLLGAEYVADKSFVLKICRSNNGKANGFTPSQEMAGKNVPGDAGRIVAGLLGLPDAKEYTGSCWKKVLKIETCKKANKAVKVSTKIEKREFIQHIKEMEDEIKDLEDETPKPKEGEDMDIL